VQVAEALIAVHAKTKTDNNNHCNQPWIRYQKEQLKQFWVLQNTFLFFLRIRLGHVDVTISRAGSALSQEDHPQGARHIQTLTELCSDQTLEAP